MLVRLPIFALAIVFLLSSSVSAQEKEGPFVLPEKKGPEISPEAHLQDIYAKGVKLLEEVKASKTENIGEAWNKRQRQVTYLVDKALVKLQRIAEEDGHEKLYHDDRLDALQTLITLEEAKEIRTINDFAHFIRNIGQIVGPAKAFDFKGQRESSEVKAKYTATYEKFKGKSLEPDRAGSVFLSHSPGGPFANFKQKEIHTPDSLADILKQTKSVEEAIKSCPAPALVKAEKDKLLTEKSNFEEKRKALEEKLAEANKNSYRNPKKATDHLLPYVKAAFKFKAAAPTIAEEYNPYNNKNEKEVEEVFVNYCAYELTYNDSRLDSFSYIFATRPKNDSKESTSKETLEKASWVFDGHYKLQRIGGSIQFTSVNWDALEKLQKEAKEVMVGTSKFLDQAKIALKQSQALSKEIQALEAAFSASNVDQRLEALESCLHDLNHAHGLITDIGIDKHGIHNEAKTYRFFDSGFKGTAHSLDKAKQIYSGIPKRFEDAKGKTK